MNCAARFRPAIFQVPVNTDGGGSRHDSARERRFAHGLRLIREQRQHLVRYLVSGQVRLLVVHGQSVRAHGLTRWGSQHRSAS